MDTKHSEVGENNENSDLVGAKKIRDERLGRWLMDDSQRIVIHLYDKKPHPLAPWQFSVALSTLVVTKYDQNLNSTLTPGNLYPSVLPSSL